MPGRYRSSNGEVGEKARARNRMLGLLGLGSFDSTIADHFDDFVLATASNVVPSWQPSPSGSGVIVTAVTGAGAGIVRADTGATAGSQMLMIGTVGQVSNVTTTKHYQRWRFRVPTTPDAQSKLLMGLFNQANNKTITVGFYGGLNASNWILQDDGVLTGTATDLGVAKDTSIHIVELYGVGSTTIFARLDEGAAVSHVMAAAPSDFCMPIWGALNGTTAATQKIEVDYCYTAFQRI